MATPRIWNGLLLGVRNEANVNRFSQVKLIFY